MSTNESEFDLSKLFGFGRCALKTSEEEPCSRKIVADLVVLISDGPEETYDVTKIPLCLNHVNDEASLRRLTRLAHDVALNTVKALRRESLFDIRFTYKLVPREPAAPSHENGILAGESELPGAPRTTSVGGSRATSMAVSWRERPFARTYVVPQARKTHNSARTPRVFTKARTAWYSLPKGERLLYERIAEQKGLPGIYVFISRFVKAVKEGNGHGPLFSLDEISSVD